MKFKVDDTTYFVKWNYSNYFEQQFRTTSCIVYTENYNEPVAIGSAYLSSNDRFCKNTGRKISLNRALQKLFPMDYNARRVAWESYFSESSKRLKK